MHGRPIPLSPPRRFLVDLLEVATAIPSVPVQRRMQLGAVSLARKLSPDRPCWPALFLKAYALVACQMPELRRAYVKLPWAQLYKYPLSVASIAVERTYQDEAAVFFGKISDPARMSVYEIDKRIRRFATDPIETIKPFCKLLRLSKWPRPVRKLALWLGLNLPRTRAGQFGTFGLSVYSSLGAESLHPLSPLTTTINYGVIDECGEVDVRIIYDHRVLDGATVARALAELEARLTGEILAELQENSSLILQAA